MSFRPGRAVIKVLPRIETEEYNKENIDDLIQLTRSRMLDTLQELATSNTPQQPVNDKLTTSTTTATTEVTKKEL